MKKPLYEGAENNPVHVVLGPALKAAIDAAMAVPYPGEVSKPFIIANRVIFEGLLMLREACNSFSTPLSAERKAEFLTERVHDLISWLDGVPEPTPEERRATAELLGNPPPAE